MFAIMADYYHWSEEKGDYTKPLYLGVTEKLKIFIFEEKITGKTKTFKTAKQAKEYLNKYLCMLGVGTCCENIRIIKI